MDGVPESLRDVGLCRFEKSPRKDKKIRAHLPDGSFVDFGHPGYEHYRDKTGLWSHLDHNDPERRKRFHARHRSYPKWTAGWFAKNVLW